MAVDAILIANAAAWLRKASQDADRIGRCLHADPPDVEDALFHCQQTAEKAMKAFLTWHDQPFRKTHDLAALATQCAGLDATLAPIVTGLDDLTEYAWAYRYPTDISEPSVSDVDEARELASGALRQIAARLPKEVREAAGWQGSGESRGPGLSLE